MPRLVWSTLACVLAFSAGFAQEGASQVVFSPSTFSADEDCTWSKPHFVGLSMNEHYIAGPKPGEDREVWLKALHAYRDAVREGKYVQTVHMNYEGVRAWVRMTGPLAKAYDFRPGDKVEVSVDARAISGNRTLCFAFDFLSRVDDVWGGWSTVVTTVDIAQDIENKQVKCSVVLPDFDASNLWAKPIVGMDATHDPAKGELKICNLSFSLGDSARMEAVQKVAETLPNPSPDLSLYDRQDLAWAAGAYACHFTFLYDSSIYNVDTGQYTLDAFLEDGRREFGGYDAIVLWQGYPRLGFDDRNQFDMYRDLPGGLAGVRNLVRQAHERNVKVYIDYNPWDTGTRREGRSDEEALASLVAEIEVDGIFLDTMVAGSPTMRSRIDAARPGVVFEPEGHPAIDQLGICSVSWAQWLNDPQPPGMLQLKWIEPRHMQHQIRRWDQDHQAEIESAFFNGSGMMVWENVFGSYNPWNVKDRALWRRASAILRAFSTNFRREQWEPFLPTLQDNLYANHWPGDKATVSVLLNCGEPLSESALFRTELGSNIIYFDLWSGEPLSVRDGAVVGSIERIGCTLAVKESDLDDPIRRLLEKQRADSGQNDAVDTRNHADSVVNPKPVQPTKRYSLTAPPSGMVYVEGATIRMRIEHVRRECGCYPDPGTPEARWKDFLSGYPFDGTITHDIGPVTVAPFLMDETEVTNAEFKKFLIESGYRPKHTENFLKHWPGGRMPAAIADLPVVYVDLDDARAYARWAGKRLPTEEEWHLAAQGTDGRKWPWGNEFDPAKCNDSGGPVPVRSYPEGRSPCGCYNMAGNVWEWTESERNDGHTRFVMVRGGSYFKAEGSVWYADGGPQPCTHHAKFIRMWPGLDRCATIGFRCAADLAP